MAETDLQSPRCIRQMNVAIDQARQDGGTAQVDDFRTRGNRHTGGRTDSGDPLALDQHNLLASIWPDFGSNNLPARTTVVCKPCDQSMAAAPNIPMTVLMEANPNTMTMNRLPATLTA